jgi:stage V sporulation protein G
VEITEVRIKLMEDASERLQAFCSITFDNSFVIRDLKIIDGANGPFVAMPSRKLTAHCPQCGCKNHLRAAHCNQCGGRLSDDRLVKDEDGRTKLYADIAHPINSSCREMIQDRVIKEFALEVDRSKLPGYRSTYDDYDHEDAIAGVPAGKDGAREKTHVQPAEHQPRSPHRPAARQPGHHPPRHAAPEQSQGKKPDGFGAGIF